VKARVLVRLRPGETRAFELPPEAVIGRDEELAVTLPFEEVSRRHARISFDGKIHWLEDLASLNGTYLNGRRVLKEREKLLHLSVVTLGAQTNLVFVTRPEETQTLRRTVIQHAFLVPETPDGVPYDIPVGEFTVGRSGACYIESDSPGVSKLHAQITRSADKLHVRDLDSANGTWVNGTRVSEASLVDGDLLAFADESYRVSVALGEVTSASVLSLTAADVAASREESRTTRRFSTDWKRRVEGLAQAAQPLVKEPMADVTSRHRGSAAADATLLPKTSQSGSVAAAAGRIEVRLLAPGVELVAAGGGSYVVGSAPDAALRLEREGVAAAHARVIVSDILGGVFLQPEEGRTLRNGALVEKTEPLQDGDTLQLGDVELRTAIRRVD
jgi:pSer/pThr/pTyr-binding forkhead associated (FHA) protein